MSLEKTVVTVSRGNKNLEKFAADYPNIRTLKGFLAGVWDFKIFEQCFPGKNRLSDVDGSIELEGHTLILEFKGAKNGMNKGQVLKAIRQAKYSNMATIFIFGNRNEPTGYLKIIPAPNEKGYFNSGYVEGNLEIVQDQLARWAKWAKDNTVVTNKSEEWNEVSEVLGTLYKK